MKVTVETKEITVVAKVFTATFTEEESDALKGAIEASLSRYVSRRSTPAAEASRRLLRNLLNDLRVASGDPEAEEALEEDEEDEDD